MREESAVDVFQFRNYRDFLVRVYEERKAQSAAFSYRAFARRIGSSAPNYLKLVSEGKRNLSPEMAVRFAEALGLKGDPANYFCDLVAFNQAASATERERCYRRLQEYPRYRRAFRLDAAHEAYHGQWYIPAVRELVACEGFQADPRWIAKTLLPRISVTQAREALSVLQQLDFIRQEARGRWVQVEEVVATGDDEPLGHHIASFHRAMMERAADAIDRVPREEREMGALTLALTEAQARAFRRELYELRQRMLVAAVDDADAAPHRVYQVNFQMFPISHCTAEENEEVAKVDSGLRTVDLGLCHRHRQPAQSRCAPRAGRVSAERSRQPLGPWRESADRPHLLRQ